MAFQALQLTGNSVTSCPDSAALSIADDLDLRIRVAMEDWAPTLDEQTFISKRVGTSEWQFRTHVPTGRLSFVWWNAAGTANAEVTNADTPFEDGQLGWVRVRRSGTSVTFYYSADDTNDHTAVSWTQLGDVQTTPSGDIRDVATHVSIGAQGGAGVEPLYGIVYAAAVVDDTTTVANPIFADSSQWIVGEDAGDTGSDGTNTWTLTSEARIIGDNIQGAHIGIQAAFGNNVFDNSVVWTDITSDMRAVSFTRGRQYELDRIQAGTMTVTLTNSHGNYNAHNTAGDYYPNIKPMVPIRLRAVYDGQIYSLWQGFVERWPVSFPATVDSVVTVECVDLFKALALADASQPDRSTAVNALNPVAWWRFSDGSDEVGSNDLTFSGSPTEGGATGAWEDDVATAFDGSDDRASVTTEADVERQGSDRSWEAWFMPDGAAGSDVLLSVSNADSTIIQTRIVHDTATNTIRVQADNTNHGIRVVSADITVDEWHHIVVADDLTSGTISRSVYLDGVLAGTTSFPEPTGTFTVMIGASPGPANFWDGNISEMAVYPTALTAQQVASLYNAQFEAFADERTDQRIAYILADSGIGLGASFIFTDLEEGQTTMSGANSPTNVSALDAIQTAVDTELGNFFMTGNGYARFHDRHYRLINQETAADTFDATEYVNVNLSLDDERIHNDVRVSPADDADPFIAQDEDSIDAYGRRTLQLTTYPLSASEAYDFAHYLKQRHAEPTTRIEGVDFRLGSDVNLWDPILSAELGTRYNIEVPLAGDDLDQDVFLEAISHSITAERVWDVHFQLSPAADDTFWLIGVAGSSEAGETTIFGF